ncbi:MAG: peptidase S41 [unclassified Hahellaceae]|nr:peptidase S41 [Hahellaceae bacterium]|tara:strand:+ start:15617 stop:16987 length:1371 start_codon:yes stop_codon:yes gene_type:complete
MAARCSSRTVYPWLLSAAFCLLPIAHAAEEASEGAEVPAAEAPAADSELTVGAAPSPVPVDDIRKFAEVFDRIKKTYVEEVDDATLINSAIRGMLSGLDPHSAYLEPSAFESLQESTTGEFGGLGIEVGMEDGFIKVITPIDDTPAQKAGVEAGDLIIKLDEQSVKGMTLDQAVDAMRGAPGSEVKLTIIRDGEEGPLEIAVERAVISVNSVKRMLLGGGVGYVRITQFQAQTGGDFVKAVQRLKKALGEKEALKGLILDLRNNPGGVLQAAVEVSDALLEDGLIVYTDGRIRSSKLRFNATPGDILEGVPVVVLINGGSASASEIVAGALQDNRRAIILGTDTFGKGSVQTVLQLDDTHGLKLTTARYYTPSGRSIQALGIEPDILVNRAKVTELQSSPIFKEADLAGHLVNGGSKKGKNSAMSEEDVKAASEMISKDFQLREGINVLRGLTILK